MDHPHTKSVPGQCGARLAFSRSAPMQRGPHFEFLRSAPMQHGARLAFRRSAPMQCGTRSVFREMLSMQNGARFAVLSGFGRSHLVGLGWSVWIWSVWILSVWIRCSGSALPGHCRSAGPGFRVRGSSGCMLILARRFCSDLYRFCYRWSSVGFLLYTHL